MIAYHLGTLVLEEIGRRELIAVQSVAAKELLPPAWPEKHAQDHVKKLFWCFFGGSFLHDGISGKRLEEFSALAESIHATRLAGLYVDTGEDILSLPQQAISAEECENLLRVATTRLTMAQSEVLREHIPADVVALQSWFLAATDDPEKRRMIFSRGSLSKLADINDAKAWTLWLKNEFDTADATARAAAEEEIKRSRDLPRKGTKDKWKIRVKILSGSHSVRPKALTVWNKNVEGIKLVSPQKNQLIFELMLKDHVPVEGLWWFGWGLARHFVVALNIGTMGFWWWRLPDQIARYYETIEDVDKHKSLLVERSPALKADWGANRVLTEQDLNRVALCMATLPGPHHRERHTAYNYYIGGLTFLSLNDVHWQCETNIFGNFFECLKAMMEEAGDLKLGTSFQEVLIRFVADMFPDLDERDHIAALCTRFDAKDLDGVVVTLKDATVMKLFCDAYFLRAAKQKIQNRQRPTNEASVSEQS